jgi:lysophospholipase L1-like esterase
MTSLNDGLTDAWQQPVFIANEGWGGSTCGSYLEMIQNDQGWQQRMRRLRPQVWLIHLGVNDERGKVAADIFSRNMEKIVDVLVNEYQADPQMIFVAKPSYDYHPDAEAILNAYRIQIDGLIEKLEVRLGPDFFSAYSKDKEKLYGDDQAHPNPTGITLMAELWTKSILSSLPKGCGT